MRELAGEELSDSRLLQLAMTGEEAAFVTLYRRWQDCLYRFSLRLSGSRSIAEDVTQEVFLALMDGGSGFDPALGSFSSYAYAIARNHVLRRLSRERLFVPAAEDGAEEMQNTHEHRKSQPDPLGDLTRQETIDSLYRAVATLPLRYREVVVLCELQELSYADAAKVIGCPEGTIRSRLHRARRLLLEKFQGKANEHLQAHGIEPAGCLL